jgi:hypothetical protein
MSAEMNRSSAPSPISAAIPGEAARTVAHGFANRRPWAAHVERDQARFVFLGDSEMKASSLSFQAAVVLVVAGMIWGIVMAATGDHAAMPAHAHLNLLGWVSLFLFGIFYHLHPAIDRSRTAMVQVWIWIAATVVLSIGVGLVHTGHESGDPIAAVSSLVIVADMLLFGWLVFRRESVAQRSAVPAE